MNLGKLFIEWKEYEKVILLVRRHPITFIPQIFLFAFFLAIPWILRWFIYSVRPEFFEAPGAEIITTLGMSGFYLFALAFFFTQFVDYFLDIWIVTNERIIDIQNQGLFSRIIAETRFYRVQDVTVEAKGFFATIFNYGNVYVQNAGTINRFVFRQVPRPTRVMQEIIKLVEEDKQFHKEKIKLLNLEEGPKVVETDAHLPLKIHGTKE